ncbi:MAG: 50S ribosomal protein L18 [Candidatus Neomarinimicrobiota bacterium]
MGYHKSVVRRKDRRRNRSKKTSFAHPSRNRLVIHRSLKHFEAQVIDDFKGHTIFSASSKCKDLKPALKNIKNKTDLSKKVGEALASKAKEMKIKSVVLDRNGYPYHGRVKAFVESVRKNGLNL